MTIKLFMMNLHDITNSIYPLINLPYMPQTNQVQVCMCVCIYECALHTIIIRKNHYNSKNVNLSTNVLKCQQTIYPFYKDDVNN